MSKQKTDSPVVPVEAPKPKRRVKMCDALRGEGLDEVAMAKQYKVLLGRPYKKEETPDAKLALDIVRDCVKILEPRAAEGIPANSVVQLVHNIPRPDRSGQSRQSDSESA